MTSSRSSSRPSVIFDDRSVVANAGLLLPALLGERLGLGALFSEMVALDVPSLGANVADKALSVVHAMLAGASCIDDVALLRAGATERVLGHRCGAPSTIGSFLRAFTVGHVRQLDRVAEALLHRAFAAGAGASGPVVLDIDSTIRETHGLHKEGARQVLRDGRRGYHPLVAAIAGSGEVVHARLRRGRTNDGSGAARFVGEALARCGRAGAPVRCLRADSGFYQADVVEACRRRGVAFSIGARQQRGMARAIAELAEEDWVPIDYPFGEGAAVAELAWRSFAVDKHGRDAKGVAVRLIVRRVPPSPSIQAPLFPTFSYHAFITDQEGDLVALDAFHRNHAEVENVIKELKTDGGLAHLPSGRFGANGAWLVLAAIAHNLARFVGTIGLRDGVHQVKRLRMRVLSVPGRITRSARRTTLHLPAAWPWAQEIRTALDRLAAVRLAT